MSLAARRRNSAPSRESLLKVELPAPSGGINTVAPLGSEDFPLTDAVYAYNVLSGGQYGSQSRRGFQEWNTGLTGGIDNTVRSTVPYQGSKKSGIADKLFMATAKGIFDCSTSGAGPPLVQGFGLNNLDAGFCIQHAFTTPAGHFLMLCDEQNGLFQYTELTNTWAPAVCDTAAPWTPSTLVVAGIRVVNGNNVYQCAVGGTTGTGTGPTGTGSGIADGATVTWNFVKAAVANAIGPSIADQNNGLHVGAEATLTSTFAFVTVWGSRLWFVERDTSRAWYLNVNSINGVATSFDFGLKMRVGGPLVGLYGWTYDSGGGQNSMSMRLVALSTAGDVVIFQGSDPSSANTFQLSGAWYLPGLPYGRRCAVEYGGDMLVLCQLGVVSLETLILNGTAEYDRTQYVTYKISRLFSSLVTQWGALQGWGMVIHPQDNCLLIFVPQPVGYAPLQLAMAFTAKRPWSVYRGLPILSAGAWNIGPGGKQLFFGTSDGRVCVNQGYVDNVTLASPGSYTAVACSILTAFYAEDQDFKTLQHCIPHILSQVPNPGIEAVAKFEFDTSEPADTSSSGAGAAGTWDNSKWDQSVWAADQIPSNQVVGLFGEGRAVALAIRFDAISLTTFVGATVFFTRGGSM